MLNGEILDERPDGFGMLVPRRGLKNGEVHLVFLKQITAVPLPDEPETCAYMVDLSRASLSSAFATCTAV